MVSCFRALFSIIGSPLGHHPANRCRRPAARARVRLEGEVRFDEVSRALYSTDASVYQIEPLGVVVVKSREDIVRTVELCRQFGCSMTMRGGGTSQAGQAIGAGLQVDTSKYFNRLLEVNVAERWARVEPGIVLDELNAALRPHGLRFAPDISTASRATVGGMMANNSSGARSVLYGKTIDHVLEQHVVLSDGSVARFAPLAAAEVDAICGRGTLEAACYREVRRLAREHAPEIERRYPKVLRRVGGYNLDAFVDPARPFNLTRLIVGSEGTLGVVLEAKVDLVPLPAAKAVLAIQFDDLLEALEATPAILEHRPSAVEVMDRFILDHTKQSAALDRLRRTFIDGDPGALLCVEFYADRARTCRRGSTRSSAISGRAASATATIARIDLAGAGQNLEPARSGARPLDGDEGRCEVVVVRRRHGGRAGAAARLHRPVPRDRRPARHDGRRLRARVGRLPARAAGRQPQDRRRRPHVRGDRRRGRRPRARVRRRAVGRARRRPGPQPVHGEDVRAGALRGVPGRQADVRSGRHLQSGQDRRRAAAHLEPAVRTGLPDAASGDVLRLLGVRRHGRRRRDVQRPRRLPQEARRHDVPVLHGDARRGALDARARQRAAPGDGRPARRVGPRRRGRARGARPVPRVPRLQGRVSGRRRRRALQERVPRRLLAAPRHAAARAVLGHIHDVSRWGSRLAPLSTWWRSAHPAMDGRGAPRPRLAAHAAGLGDDERSAERFERRRR